LFGAAASFRTLTTRCENTRRSQQSAAESFFGVCAGEQTSSIVIVPYAYGDIKAAISILFVHCAVGISIKNGRTIISHSRCARASSPTQRLSYHRVWFLVAHHFWRTRSRFESRRTKRLIFIFDSRWRFFHNLETPISQRGARSLCAQIDFLFCITI
jgi:hypothetical protein